MDVLYFRIRITCEFFKTISSSNLTSFIFLFIYSFLLLLLFFLDFIYLFIYSFTSFSPSSRLSHFLPILFISAHASISFFNQTSTLLSFNPLWLFFVVVVVLLLLLLLLL